MRQHVSTYPSMHHNSRGACCRSGILPFSGFRCNWRSSSQTALNSCAFLSRPDVQRSRFQFGQSSHCLCHHICGARAAGPVHHSHMHCQTVRRAAPLSPGVFSSAAWSTSTVHAASPSCLASYAPLKSVTPQCCTARVRTTLLLAAFSVFPIHGPIRAPALHWYCRDVLRCRWPRAHHAEAGYVPSCGFGISKACFAGRLLMNTSRR